MPQKVVKFTGIDRKVNEFQSSGACEELINIRPTINGLEIVKPKKVLFSDANYDVYNHAFADKSLFIGVRNTGVFQLYLIDEDGNKSIIDEIEDAGSDYSIAFLGNQMLMSVGTELRVYAYKDNKYGRVDAETPEDLDVTYTIETGYGVSKDVSVASDPRKSEFKNVIMENWSAALGENSYKDEIFGPILVAFNFTMNDGTEFWTNKWIYVNPFLALPVGENGKHMVYYEDGDTKKVTFKSYKVHFTIKQITTSSTENLVKNVNVYATRPVFPFNIDTMYVNQNNPVHEREIYGIVTNLKDSGITNQLLYYQKSFPISKLKKENTSFYLDFGEGQVGEKVLEIDNGPMRRTGKMVAYNNRAHVYDSYATIVPQSVVCTLNAVDASDTDEMEYRDAYIYLDCNNKTVVLETKALVPTAREDVVHKISCLYPDARAKKILIAHPTAGYSTVELSQSSRYNCAYGEADYPSGIVSASSITKTSPTIHEANAINVSGQYNPFVFPVEYSYSIGGKVLDLVTSYLPISSTQIGQYPLTIFTSNGIYAMEQGSGGTLYGNIIPLQPLVIEGKACATPYGTFFSSAKSLYVLSGREAANVSQVLNGEIELPIRDLEAYRALCCSGGGVIADFEEKLSQEDFEDYVIDSYLTYDQLNNELYISNKAGDILYSYVFNLDTKSFHKIEKKYFNAPNGARYVVEVDEDDRYVVDLHTEEKTESAYILLQSRPFALEALSTHIDRLLLMVDTKLSESQYLILSVFGSDNLYDWKCIITSQKTNTVLRHIRTNRSAKSYRYYVILINGKLYSESDISDLIADYTVVNRRLG